MASSSEYSQHSLLDAQPMSSVPRSKVIPIQSYKTSDDDYTDASYRWSSKSGKTEPCVTTDMDYYSSSMAETVDYNEQEIVIGGSSRKSNSLSRPSFLAMNSSLHGTPELYPSSAITYGEAGSSFGLPYNDHNYALAAHLEPKFQQKQSEASAEDDFIPFPYSHDYDMSMDESQSDNSLNVLAQVARAMSTEVDPVHSPTHRDNDMDPDPHWTVAGEEVVTTNVASSLPKENRKKVSVLISNKRGLSLHAVSTGQDFNQQTGKPQHVAISRAVTLGSSVSLRRYRYSGSSGQTVVPGQQIRRVALTGGPSGQRGSIILQPTGGMVLTYGGGIIPASNTTVGLIRCICGYTHDDGYMIQCDKCKVWQHVDCALPNSSKLPTNYFCDSCHPRVVNYNRAVNTQRQKLNQEQHNQQQQKQKQQQQQHQHQLGQLAVRSIHTSPRTSKRKQDLVSRTPEATEYTEMVSSGRAPSSPGAAPHLSPGGAVTSLVHITSTEHSGQLYQLISPNAPSGPVMSTGVVVNGNTMVNMSSVNGHADSTTVEVSSSTRTRVISQSAGPPSPRVPEPTPAPPRDYEEARENCCSKGLRKVLEERWKTGRLPLEAIVDRSSAQCQIQAKLCRVVSKDFNRKALEATQNVRVGDTVIEYRGFMTFLDDYNDEYDYRKHYNPFALFYEKQNEFNVVVDARHYGNDARFIRRSCDPNCEVRHIFVNARLHLLVVAMKAIPHGYELTLPFDFDYWKCRYPVTCACGKKACQVARWYRRQDRKHAAAGAAQTGLNRTLSGALIRSPLSGGYSQPGLLHSRSTGGALDRLDADEGVDADVYEFLDEETRRKKKKFARLIQREKLKQQLIRNSMVGVPRGRGRGRGRMVGVQRNTSVALPKTAKKKTKTESVRGRTLSENKSRQDLEELSADGSEATEKGRRRSNSQRNDSGDSKHNSSKEEPSVEPSKKLTRDEIWMQQVMKRIERMEKQKSRRRASSKSTEQSSDKSADDASAIWTAKVENDSTEKDTADATTKDEEEKSSGTPMEIKEEEEAADVRGSATSVEEEKVTRPRSRRASQLRQCSKEEEEKVVITYHRTSMEELQKDIDAVIGSLPDKDEEEVPEKSSEKTEINGQDADVAVETPRHDTFVQPSVSSATKNTKGKSSQQPKTVTELSFEEFIQQYKGEGTEKKDNSVDTVDPKPGSHEMSTPKRRKLNHEPAGEVKDENSTSDDTGPANKQVKTPRAKRPRKNDDAKKQDGSLHESREERWLRITLMRIEEMEEKKKKRKRNNSNKESESESKDVEEGSTVVKAADETLNQEQEDVTGVSRVNSESSEVVAESSIIRRRNSSKEDASSPNKKSPRRTSPIKAEELTDLSKSPRSRKSSGIVEDHCSQDGGEERNTELESSDQETISSPQKISEDHTKISDSPDKPNNAKRPASRRSSTASERSRGGKSGRRPSTPIRIRRPEPQERLFRTKKDLLENWKQEECNLIVYRPQVENPMEKFSRSVSTSSSAQLLACSTPTPPPASVPTTPTPTKKRWLSQAIMDQDGEADTSIETNMSVSTVMDDNLPTPPPGGFTMPPHCVLMAPPNTPVPQFNPKKRIMAQFSVEDQNETAASPLRNSASNSPVLSAAPSGPLAEPVVNATHSPAKLPPKKATLKKREEERRMMEMKKIRMSLSEYRRRRNITENSPGQTDGSMQEEQMSPTKTPSEDAMVERPAEEGLAVTSKPSEVEEGGEKAVSVVEDECGPRTPSDPAEDEEEMEDAVEAKSMEVNISESCTTGVAVEQKTGVENHSSVDSASMEGGRPRTPAEMDDDDDEGNGDSRKGGDGDGSDSERMETDADDRIEEALMKIYPSLNVMRDEDELKTLQDIMKRDEEIRNMQELKTLERKKFKLLHELRSVERGIEPEPRPVAKPTQTVQPMTHSVPRPSSNSGGQSSAVSGSGQASGGASGGYRVPLKEKVAPTLVATVAPLQAGGPNAGAGKAVDPGRDPVGVNLSIMSQTLSTFRDRLRQQVEQAKAAGVGTPVKVPSSSGASTSRQQTSRAPPTSATTKGGAGSSAATSEKFWDMMGEFRKTLAAAVPVSADQERSGGTSTSSGESTARQQRS